MYLQLLVNRVTAETMPEEVYVSGVQHARCILNTRVRPPSYPVPFDASLFLQPSRTYTRGSSHGQIERGKMPEYILIKRFFVTLTNTHVRK